MANLSRKVINSELKRLLLQKTFQIEKKELYKYVELPSWEIFAFQTSTEELIEWLSIQVYCILAAYDVIIERNGTSVVINLNGYIEAICLKMNNFPFEALGKLNHIYDDFLLAFIYNTITKEYVDTLPLISSSFGINLKNHENFCSTLNLEHVHDILNSRFFPQKLKGYIFFTGQTVYHIFGKINRRQIDLFISCKPEVYFSEIGVLYNSELNKHPFEGGISIAKSQITYSETNKTAVRVYFETNSIPSINSFDWIQTPFGHLPVTPFHVTLFIHIWDFLFSGRISKAIGPFTPISSHSSVSYFSPIYPSSPNPSLNSASLCTPFSSPSFLSTFASPFATPKEVNPCDLPALEKRILSMVKTRHLYHYGYSYKSESIRSMIRNVKTCVELVKDKQIYFGYSFL